MNIHFISPFSRTKDLAKAYNDTIKHLPAEDWICLMDYDAMLLLPEQVNRMYEYIEAYPDTSLFVCYGSRCKDGIPQQLLIYENDFNVKTHINLAAERLKLHGTAATPVQRSVAGFLMLFSKATWERHKFIEGVYKCLRVDTAFSKGILRTGGNILLMESIYVWHSYRLMEGKQSIKHLL